MERSNNSLEQSSNRNPILIKVIQRSDSEVVSWGAPIARIKRSAVAALCTHREQHVLLVLIDSARVRNRVGVFNDRDRLACTQRTRASKYKNCIHMNAKVNSYSNANLYAPITTMLCY